MVVPYMDPITGVEGATNGEMLRFQSGTLFG